ncbi:histidine kinase [Microbacterium sp. A93]|uniref:histidine kinase n=1 Tax=unclassified Microbacterium TaxID=2609290 RepID=UPI003F43B331
MQTTQKHPQRLSLTEVTPALVFAGIAFGGLLLLPLLQAADPEAGVVPLSPAAFGWWVLVAVIAVQATALLRAKRSPRLVLLVVASAPLVLAFTAPASTFNLTVVGITFAVFLAVLREPLRNLSAVMPATIVLVAFSQVVNDVRAGAPLDVATVGMAAVQALVAVGGSLVIALFFAARRDARVSRGNEVLALRRERDALIQAAVSRERMAMSRELHDIAAHHMSGIALLSSAIYRQVDTDPEAAKTSAQQARAQSTMALDDLRRVIGLLRDDANSSRTVETLASVSELVELRKSSGLPVEYEVRTGERTLGTGIGPLAQLVVYRTVQEALANVVAHAPGAHCVVMVDDRAPDVLVVQITNDGSHAPDLGPGGGFGLVGMQERADLIGAELQHGLTDQLGWRVRLTVKREAA